MAVAEQTPYKEYVANGVTTSFPLEFDCENQDHLIVTVNDIEPENGQWSLLNGAVVFGVAPANQAKIAIQRNTPLERNTNYQTTNNSFRPQPVNKDFDRIWWKLQELGVADWILSNRINDLRAYVDKQDNVLQDNIDSLKNYVDDKDDELRNYLLNAIQEQGVALDQLEEYYSYLMQQLAQVAIDRGWAASFIVSADGSTQQQVNDRIGNTWYAKPLGYELNARVMLTNGDIVRSTVANNTTDPNVDMTGWASVNANKSSDILDDSGLNQQQINEVLFPLYCAKAAGISIGEDITDKLNALILRVSEGGGGTVHLPDGEYWVKAHDEHSTASHYLHDSGGIAMKNNVHLELSDGCVLKAIATSERRYNIIRMYNVQNAVVRGGALLGERDTHIAGGQVGEWGYGVAITGGKNNRVLNTHISKCYGDGVNLQVYFDTDSVPHVPEDITIQGVQCLYNRRQGMSIEGGRRIRVLDSAFSYTEGAAPQCGIDIEPWATNAPVDDLVITGCRVEGNAHTGITIGGYSGVSNVRIYRNHVQDNKISAMDGAQITVYDPHNVDNHDIHIFSNYVVNTRPVPCYSIKIFSGRDFTVTDNISMNCGVGLSVYSSDLRNIAIQRNINYFDATYTHDFLIMNNDLTINDAAITGLVFTDNQYVFDNHGGSVIYVRGIGSIVTDNTFVGMNVIDMGVGNVVTDNTICNTFDSALKTHTQSKRTVLERNIIFNFAMKTWSSGIGVVLQGTGAICIDNKFLKNVSTGTTIKPEQEPAYGIQNLGEGNTIVDTYSDQGIEPIHWNGINLTGLSVRPLFIESIGRVPNILERPIGYEINHEPTKRRLVRHSDGWYDYLGNRQS